MLRRLLYTFGLVMLLPINSAAQGPLLWERQEDFHGGHDAAEAITLSGKTAIVVGNSTEPLDGDDEHDLVVQALRRRTGALQWSDQAFLSSCCIENLFLATRQKRAFAVGTRREPGQAASAFLVRGYDVPTGALLWENVWTASPNAVDADHPTDIVAGPTAVVVLGYGENAGGNGLALLVRAYDPLTGAVLWDDRVGDDNVDVIGWRAAVNRNRLFVAGSAAPAANPAASDMFVRAYEVQSGDVEWEVSRTNVSPVELELSSGRLFVAGASSGGASATYLAALSAKTGAALWEDTAPLPGFFNDIAVKGSRLVGAIQVGAGFAIRAYDANTGAIEWQENSATPPGFSEAVLAVDMNDKAVYVAGRSTQDFRYSELVVRAYEGRTGALLWDDRSHRTNAGVNTFADVALGKHRLFVAGFTFNDAANADFLIRAYDVRKGAAAGP